MGCTRSIALASSGRSFEVNVDRIIMGGLFLFDDNTEEMEYRLYV